MFAMFINITIIFSACHAHPDSNIDQPHPLIEISTEQDGGDDTGSVIERYQKGQTQRLQSKARTFLLFVPASFALALIQTMSSPPATFKGDWITPEHPDYAKAIARWAVNAERRAKVVAFVKDNDDVHDALQYAKENNLPLAIRGGGHSPSGASSIEGGLVIDLSRYLAGVRVDPDKQLAYVGGGVDKAAIAHGLASVAGTVDHAALCRISLLLGGGYGYLTGQHGLVIDNLVQATVVIADGSALTANATENPDLYWAIRGGGSNFGVATEFVLQLHPQRRRVFAGLSIFPPTVLAKMNEILAEWWEKGPGGKETILQALTKGPDGKPCIVLVLFWNGSEEEGRARFEQLFDLVPNAIHMLKQNDYVAPRSNYYMKYAFVSGPQPDVAEDILSHLDTLTEKNKLRMMFIYEFFPIKKALSVPTEATAYVRRPRLATMVFVSWDNDGLDKLADVRLAATELLNLALSAEHMIPPVENTGYGNYRAQQSGRPCLQGFCSDVQSRGSVCR
ncbi:hypothetical protein HETIRDRAFT_435322 [Heterobasidion irregulare TC 32-1]|uniref:FAD-binding PCMH-type domain-containing protein n=1 Tax=Heterobasidion irregulare (strain TC 32-1) TaxID=747525 RepID=W4JYR3_HETIT|nr:uncharacterized protein HETIRDRAFT_435322 [Heterobasidion irregulare TC 32-1]ETW78594.1 hypothetical protein HETIRDRAFT_435322 [Heterobasidion irregulare TC 32-1]